jgi:hypothetical protein
LSHCINGFWLTVDKYNSTLYMNHFFLSKHNNYAQNHPFSWKTYSLIIYKKNESVFFLSTVYAKCLIQPTLVIILLIIV